MTKLTTTLTSGNDFKILSTDDDTVYGLAGDDIIFGGAGKDTLFGGANNDTLTGGTGLDTLDGGAGIDTADYRFSGSAVVVNLATHQGYMTGYGNAADLDTLVSIENITGSNHGDTLVGDDGVNVIKGGGGNDTIAGGYGADKLYGQDGDDRFTFRDGEAPAGEIIDGGVGIDRLVIKNTSGAEFNDATLTSIEAIEFDAMGGSLYAGVKASQFGGGQLSLTALVVDASGGGNALFVSMAAETSLDLSGLTFQNWDNSDSVVVMCQGLGETITGTSRNDIVRGGGGADTLHGGGGDDYLEGGAGDDIVDGGAGTGDRSSYAEATAGVIVNLALAGAQDTLGAGKDTLTGIEYLDGSSFADTLFGNAGSNKLEGGDSDDIIAGGGGADLLYGGDGADDTLHYGNSGAAVTVNLKSNSASGGDAAGDTIGGFENVIGSQFADTLTGEDGANTLLGLGGADKMDGGLGADTSSYAASSAAVVVSLDGALTATGDAVGDSFISIEYLIGSNLDAAGDRLRGDGGANTLTGLRGADILEGRDGQDTLYGGIGDDNLTGGNGADKLAGGDGIDRFRFDALSEGGDTITDFNGAFDFMKIKASGFAGLAAGQALTASQFVASAAPVASGAAGQFLYETDTGILSWDANGAGAGGATVIATLTGMPSLALDDFQIF